jgi:superfamily II DNA or RNA helicase
MTTEKDTEAGRLPEGEGPAPRALVSQARALREAISEVVAAPPGRLRAARAAYELARDAVVRQQLAELPLARLKETTQGRLRVGLIEAAGYRTVGQAAAAGAARLQQIKGVGPQTATQVVAAARQLATAMMQSVRLRFDPDGRPPAQTRLLAELHAYEVARQAASPAHENLDDMAAALDAVLTGSRRAASRLRMFFSGARSRDEARSALSQLGDLMRVARQSGSDSRLQQSLVALAAKPPDAARLWQDYEEHAVFYNGLLIEVGELTPDIESGQGFIPADIAQRVHQHPLDLSLMRASLRGYQAFGAKFALCQRRAMLGDEMGLGKSVEALAAMCHLHVEGQRHFLVVCPASVLVNWTHEIRRHSELRSHRLHGPDRQRHFQAWTRTGGIAVTTYDSLRSLPKPAGMDLGLLVVDEAHYTKNMNAERTKAVREWARTTSCVLFLTGTPMENRVEEFRVLVGHLQPGLLPHINNADGLIGAGHFRAAVAPVYLRRNQSDVLQELPPRVDIEEWVELKGRDWKAYRDAVAAGNFMAMRRAAYASGHPADSAKLGRLVEIVEEASANRRKVVVFSYFRDVLDVIAVVLGGVAVGPLTGSTPPIHRQAMVDEFSARPGPAVLVSQIQAGGVGLNIQAASVVILAEPQWKPTSEDQAIARCHRMGQVRSVDVHRLLGEDTVDQRMLEILATKAVLFDEYVRRSELKDHSPDAVDVSDLKAAQDVGNQVEAERRIIEMERKRLRMEADSPPQPNPASG